MLQRCAKNLTIIFDTHKVDHTHGIHHAMVVVQHGRKAVQANSNLSDEHKQDILLACLLHDADDKKYFPTSNNYSNARTILTQYKIEQNRVQNIVSMISVVSFSKNGDTIDQSKGENFYYPRYSDRIDAIGYNGLIRCYEYAKHVNNPICTPETIKPRNAEELEKISVGRNQAYIKNGGKSKSVIDHIYDKLIHLTLPSFITNPYLISMYAEGKQEIIDFVLRHSPTKFQNVKEQLQQAIDKRQAK